MSSQSDPFFMFVIVLYGYILEYWSWHDTMQLQKVLIYTLSDCWVSMPRLSRAYLTFHILDGTYPYILEAFSSRH